MQKILLFLVFKKNWKLTGCIYVYKKNQNDILLPKSAHCGVSLVVYYYLSWRLENNVMSSKYC